MYSKSNDMVKRNLTRHIFSKNVKLKKKRTHNKPRIGSDKVFYWLDIYRPDDLFINEDVCVRIKGLGEEGDGFGGLNLGEVRGAEAHAARLPASVVRCVLHALGSHAVFDALRARGLDELHVGVCEEHAEVEPTAKTASKGDRRDDRVNFDGAKALEETSLLGTGGGGGVAGFCGGHAGGAEKSVHFVEKTVGFKGG